MRQHVPTGLNGSWRNRHSGMQSVASSLLSIHLRRAREPVCAHSEQRRLSGRRHPPVRLSRSPRCPGDPHRCQKGLEGWASGVIDGSAPQTVSRGRPRITWCPPETRCRSGRVRRLRSSWTLHGWDGAHMGPTLHLEAGSEPVDRSEIEAWGFSEEGKSSYTASSAEWKEAASQPAPTRPRRRRRRRGRLPSTRVPKLSNEVSDSLVADRCSIQSERPD